jgi:hypothetical protein
MASTYPRFFLLFKCRQIRVISQIGNLFQDNSLAPLSKPNRSCTPLKKAGFLSRASKKAQGGCWWLEENRIYGKSMPSNTQQLQISSLKPRATGGLARGLKFSKTGVQIASTSALTREIRFTEYQVWQKQA